MKFAGRFEQARYFYDVYLPEFNYEPTKKGFTILLRLLNADGFPVSEEQEILMKVPRVPIRHGNGMKEGNVAWTR